MRARRIHRITSALAITATVFLLARPAAGEPAEPPGTLRVKIELRASNDDAIDVCRRAPLEEGPAERLGRAIAEALGIGDSDIVFDPTIAEHCAVINPDGSLHRADPARTHGRRFVLDTAALLDATEAAGFRRLRLEICTPVVHRSFDAPDPNEATLCEWRGWGWVSDQPLRIAVSFWATPADLTSAIAFTATGLVILTLLLLLIGRRALRGGRLITWLVQRRWAGYVVIVVAIIGGAIGWVALAYETWLVHSLQLIHGIGPIGEGIIVFGPMALITLGIVRTGTSASERVGRTLAPPAEDDDHLTADPLPPPRRPPAISLMVAFVVFGTPGALIQADETTRPIIVGFLAFSAVVSVLAPMLLGFIAGTGRGRRTMEGDALVPHLRELGMRVRRVLMSATPLLDPGGAALPRTILRAGDTVLVWDQAEKRATPRPASVALAAGPSASLWFVTFGSIAVAAVRDVSEPAAGAPWWAYAVAISAAAGREALRIVERRTILDRIRSSGDPAATIRDGLRLMRMEARVFARWLESGSMTLPRRGLRRRRIPPPSPEELRSDALDAARAHAELIGLSPMMVDGLAAEAWPASDTDGARGSLP